MALQRGERRVSPPALPAIKIRQNVGDMIEDIAGRRQAESHHERRQAVIDSFLMVIRRHLEFAKAETLRKLEEHYQSSGDALQSAEGGGVVAEIIFNLSRFSKGLLAAIRSASAKALQTAGEQLYQELGRDDAWKMPDPRAIEFLDNRENLLSDIPEEIHTGVAELIKEGFEEGDGIEAMAKKITDKFDAISQERARVIASTETAAAYGLARHEAMKAAGVRYKAWLTSHLPNVRDFHAAAEEDPQNQRTPIDEPFIVGGEELMYPGDEAGSPHNVINCHCISVAVGGAQ